MAAVQSASPGKTHTRQPARFTWRRIERRFIPYLFLSPFLIGYIAFMVYPLVYSLNLSLYRKQLAGGTTFVGLANYGKVLADEFFWEGIRNVLTFGVVQIPVMLGLALLFALLLDGAVVRFKGLFRLGFFLPFAV